MTASPSSSAERVPPISDYALIGDCRAAALVARSGSIDWLCAPRFDSPSLFGGLLDPDRGGRFRVSPRNLRRIERAYVEDTNVLETTFVTDTGRLRLTDLLPVASQADKQRLLLPDHELIRRLEGLDGVVEVDIHCEPRPDYGRCALHFEARGPLGFFGEADGRVVVVRSDADLELHQAGTAVCGRIRVGRGERRSLTLSLDAGHPAILPPLGDALDRRIHRSIHWWAEWAHRCTYDGPHRAQVVRSALVLKLLSFAPSGAIVAAPTTSLPEWIGGVRNWDYRYCWLRDASFTLRALFGLGYDEEGRAFLSWLLHATRLTWPGLQVLYDVYGESRIKEVELDHLAGYLGSRPVRVGNAAADQLQLDIYGEVVDAVYRFVRLGGHLDRATGRMLAGLGETVCRRWAEPDHGIWEPRSGRVHHTLSRAMCWVALDRLIALHDDGHLKVPVARFRAERQAIRQEVESRGYSEELQSYVSALDGRHVDASLLLMALYQYVDPADARMVQTRRRIYEHLGRGSLLYRYLAQDDGLPPGEGAFGIAGFWGVQCLALAGDCATARHLLDDLFGYANDLGLFAEEYDPATRTALGNFPQAFTHVGVINAAITLAACERGRSPDVEMEQQQPLVEEQV